MTKNGWGSLLARHSTNAAKLWPENLCVRRYEWRVAGGRNGVN